MSKRHSPPSAHDVARVAGVSQAAVSRAFTPGASIASATREKVFEAAKALGYRPNLLARSLIRGKSGIIGVVMGTPAYPYFLTVLSALSGRLADADRHILIYTADSDAVCDPQVEALLKFRAEAVMVMGASISAELARQCRAEGVRIVSLGRPARRLTGVSSVVGDNIRGGAAIAAHLLEQGYERLAVIAGVTETPTNHDREFGFTEHLLAQGRPQPLRAIGYFDRERAAAAARELLSRTPRPDALFCANDEMALAAIEVARYEFGLEIGRELGVAGFDDIEQAAWPSFQLTTYSLPVDQLTEKTVDILLDENAGTRPTRAVVEGALKVRRSTQRR